jgi:hypothetical protein
MNYIRRHLGKRHVRRERTEEEMLVGRVPNVGLTTNISLSQQVLVRAHLRGEPLQVRAQGADELLERLATTCS